MARAFDVRFRRRVAAGFAGDAAPVAAQVVNDPATGVGVLLRMTTRRRDDPTAAPRRIQGSIVNGGAYAGTWTLQLYIALNGGTGAGAIWAPVGVPLAAVPGNGTLWESAGVIMTADVVIAATPSVALAGIEIADFYLEESQ